MVDMDKIQEALVAADANRLCELVQSGIDQGLPAKDILNQGLIPAMDVVGERMESGEMFIPEVLMSANAMRQAVGILQPLLSAEDSRSAGKVVIGTVKGDLHDIGKNLVAMMLESAGFEVVNLGIDVAPEAFAAAVEENRPDIVALSALLTTTMGMIRNSIAVMQQKGLRDQVKVIIGGAPVTQNFADEVGADGYAADAGGAAKLAKSLMKAGRSANAAAR
ncbi:MAG TPA: corrinoid protein [Desulfobacterales bacterium]